MGGELAASDLENLPGIGPALAERLGAAGYPTLRALALAVPARYREVFATERLDPSLLGRELRLRCIVEGARRLRTRRGLGWSRVRLRVDPERPVVIEAHFFGQPWIATQLVAGETRLCEGRLARRLGRWELQAPRLLPPGTELVPGRLLVPVRSSPVEGISPERFAAFARAAIDAASDELRETLPAALLARLGLLPLREALLELHAPSGDEARLEAARRRLAAIEAEALLAAVRRRREDRARRRAWPIRCAAAVEGRIRARLPFEPSDEQERAIREILQDLAAPRPMARLLMGDVGCGKTLVALHACLAAAAAGKNSVLLVPTELLAEQHAQRFATWLAGSSLPVLCFTASQGPAERREALALLAGTRPCLAIGTHALLSADVRIARLGLLVIDEQQRFGVAQRAALWREHDGHWPHVLVMSATPIPRTLATALFGDLDLSELRRPPVPRPAPRTELLPHAAWPAVRARIRREVADGGRVFVVCPRIGSEEEADDGAKATFAELRELVPSELVHGKLEAASRRRAQEAFRSGRRPCLVGTTVLEVGIDVPEATLMVVRGAERLGLSTLHQLRGRVGRGARPATCLLLRDPAATRLDVLAECSDGFALAEADLRQRGAGELTGLAQSGHARFRCLDPLEDLDLLIAAQRGEFGATTFAEGRTGECSSSG